MTMPVFNKYAQFPFAGIVSERPYPETGLTTQRWKTEVRPSLIRFKSIWLTQEGVAILSLFDIPSSHSADDRYPHVVYFNGMYFLENGHSRIVRMALADKFASLARIWMTHEIAK